MHRQFDALVAYVQTMQKMVEDDCNEKSQILVDALARLDMGENSISLAKILAAACEEFIDETPIALLLLADGEQFDNVI